MSFTDLFDNIQSTQLSLRVITLKSGYNKALSHTHTHKHFNLPVHSERRGVHSGKETVNATVLSLLKGSTSHNYTVRSEMCIRVQEQGHSPVTVSYLISPASDEMPGFPHILKLDNRKLVHDDLCTYLLIALRTQAQTGEVM